MSNSLSELNTHLFAQIDRLAIDGLTPEQIETEVKRASAIVSVSDTIIDNAKTQLVAAKLFAEHGSQVLPMLPKIAASNGVKDEQS
jgi:ribosomal protein L17